MSLVLLLGGVLFLYILIYKPEFIAILLFTFIIANINFDIKGLPLNSRAIMTIALFLRIVVDKSMTSSYPAFLRITGIKIFLTYLLYILFISAAQDTYTYDLLKEIISVILAGFLVYHFFFTSKNGNTLKAAIILAGLICFGDLAYTYMAYGSFPVQRLYLLLTGVPAQEIADENFLDSLFNHNFFGQVCGMCFVYVLSDLIKSRQTNKLTIVLLPLMFLGLLMSTSRSALLATILISVFIILNAIKYKELRKKALRVSIYVIGAITGGILLFFTVVMYFKVDSKFVDEVVFRLTEEPVAIIQKSLGQNYNAQNLGSMDWREEASADAYAAYMKLDVLEQLTGIGQGGFFERNLGHGFNPHNGILLILIESGVFGFILYFLLIGGTIWQSVKQKNISPSLAVLGFILIYGIGQNNELTSATAFLFVALLIAENKFLHLPNDKPNYEMDLIHARD